MKRDSHAMTEANWQAVDAAAKAVGCPSWRVMLRKIATGELSVKAGSISEALEKENRAADAVVIKRQCEAMHGSAYVLTSANDLATRRGSAAPIRGGLIGSKRD